MEIDGIKIYTKSDEELENQFLLNKEFNKKLEPEHHYPENMIEFIEKLIIENIRTIKNLENENIPSEIKVMRMQHLEKVQQKLLDRLDELTTI
jgi:hypothetical protein